MSWYSVDLPYANFAIIVENEMIVEAAPIARWAIGKTLVSFSRWVYRKHGSLEPV